MIGWGVTQYYWRCSISPWLTGSGINFKVKNFWKSAWPSLYGNILDIIVSEHEELIQKGSVAKPLRSTMSDCREFFVDRKMQIGKPKQTLHQYQRGKRS